MSEEVIQSYMHDFNVNRETAIKEINEVLEDYYNKQEEDMQEVYEWIIRESH